MRLARISNLVFWGGLIAVVLTGLVPVTALAVVSQGYQFKGTPLPGSLVAADPLSPESVVLADQAHIDNLLGVVVPPSSQIINLTAPKDTAQVATDGDVYVIVSTANGPIKKGDHITVSPIAGVGAKAVTSTRVVGTADEDFSGNEAAVDHQVVAAGGKSQDVAIGQIPVKLEVTFVNIAGKTPSSLAAPRFIQQAANSLAGHAVSIVRLAVAGLIMLVALISCTVLLYSAVQSSVISIGRNPLAKSSIYQQLFRVMAVVAGILGVAVGGMYMVIAK